jgi:hypothetical protein
MMLNAYMPTVVKLNAYNAYGDGPECVHAYE